MDKPLTLHEIHAINDIRICDLKDVQSAKRLLKQNLLDNKLMVARKGKSKEGRMLREGYLLGINIAIESIDKYFQIPDGDK